MKKNTDTSPTKNKQTTTGLNEQGRQPKTKQVGEGGEVHSSFSIGRMPER